MKQQTALAHVVIKLNGSPLSEEISHDVIEVLVDTSLHMPNMFTIRLRDPELTWVDSSQFDLGTAVEISSTAPEQGERSGAKGVLIKGVITSLEPEYNEDGLLILVVHGYDHGHLLHRGKKVRTFVKMSDSDIVTKVAREAGLTAKTDPTKVVHEHVIQNNQTDWEFLLTRAQLTGYQLFVEGKELYFTTADKKRGDGPELTWQRNLRSFRPRMSALHQVDEVKVFGWDGKNKTPLEGMANQGSLVPKVGVGSWGGAAAKKAFGGKAERRFSEHPVASKDEAKALAEGIAQQLSGDFIQAEGVADGDPRILAGRTIKITNLGQRFSGTYYVTSAVHIFNEYQGYETSFSISGHSPNTISYLVNGESTNGREGWGTINGVVIGLVSNLNDPDGIGRVKVKYPWYGKVGGAEIESDWIRIAAPMAGKGRGFYYLPEMNDEVLIAFEHGNVNRPYIIGVLWNSKDTPPKKNGEVSSGGTVNQRIIRSRSGHEIMLDDTSGKECLYILDKTGKNQIMIDSAKNDMVIKVANNLTIEVGGKIAMTSKSDFAVDSKGKVGMAAATGMAMESKATLAVKSTGMMDIETKAKGTVKGTSMTVEGTGQAELKSSGITQVQGSLVKIN